MGPEVSTNVQSILRAMEEVIIPSLDEKNGLAREQAQLILVYLRLIKTQHDKIFHFRIKEVEEYSALLEKLLHKAAPGLPSAQQASKILEQAAPLRAMALPAYSEFAETARTLREAADKLVADLLKDGSSSSVADEIRIDLLEQARREALRERSWVANIGLDPFPEELKPLDEILG